MQFKSFIAAAAGLASVASGHVTLNPNFGAAAGGHFKFHVKIPHGTAGLETTKLVIDIPHGVLSAKPEAIHGWDITTVKRQIKPYESHGKTKDTATSQIVYTAKCNAATPADVCSNDDHPGLHNDHLFEVALQVKLGCDFGVDAEGKASNDATTWQGQHTLWFNVEQFLSTIGTNDGNTNSKGDMLSWTGVVSDMQSWNAGKPRPSPYLFIYSSPKCVADSNTGDANEVGMRWGPSGSIIPPATDMGPVKTKAEVIALMDEELLTLQETLQQEIDSNKRLIKSVETFALAGIIVGAISLVVLVFMVLCRAVTPKGFRRALLSSDDVLINKGDQMDMGN